jgi:hypothetical protein
MALYQITLRTIMWGTYRTGLIGGPSVPYTGAHDPCVFVYKGNSASQPRRPDSSNNAELQTIKVPRAEADRWTERNKHLVTSGNYLEVLETTQSRGSAVVTWRRWWWCMEHCYWCHMCLSVNWDLRQRPWDKNNGGGGETSRQRSLTGAMTAGEDNKQ